MCTGFQFHLAASINAETDIPLVPSISGGGALGGGSGSAETEQSFVIHWLNNKEMHFTAEAENILLEVSLSNLVYVVLKNSLSHLCIAFYFTYS